MREAFRVELTVRHLFDAPTIELLARSIEQTREATIDQNDQIDEMLKLVEQLSENEIQELLLEQRGQREGVDYT